jgi:hemolysin activation/secretion protein
LLWAGGAAYAQAPSRPAAGESARFEIRRFIFDGATLVPREQLEAATRPFTGPERTFADVQRAREAIERAYGRAGYSAVRVVLPEQVLEHGEVRFRVIEARISRLIVEGNRYFDEANVRASVPSLAPGEAPNARAIGRNLRVANGNPDKQTSVVLRGGSEPAGVDALVRVTDQPPQRFSVTLDNTGTQQTGIYRVGLGFQNANLWGLDHVLTMQVIGAPNDDQHPSQLSTVPSKNVLIAGVGYHVPLYALGDALDFLGGYSNVDSGTVQNVFNVSGAGTLAAARYTHNFDKMGDYDHGVALLLDYRAYDNSGVRAVAGGEQLIPDVTVHPATALYFGLYREADTETSFSLGVSQNLPGGNDGSDAVFCASRNNGIGDCASASYSLARWGYDHSRALAHDWRLHLALNGQYTRDMLVTGEQFGLGGADSVRGFTEREILGDKGYRGTVELYTPDIGAKTGVSGARLRGLVFGDWGAVRRINPGPGEPAGEHISSAGLGLRYARGNSTSFRLDYAVVLNGGGLQHRGDARGHFSFAYVF